MINTTKLSVEACQLQPASARVQVGLGGLAARAAEADATSATDVTHTAVSAAENTLSTAASTCRRAASDAPLENKL